VLPEKVLERDGWRCQKCGSIKDLQIHHNLRATFASRLGASGTPGEVVAQMQGHSGTSILHTYAKAIDENRREAIKKFEAYRHSHLIELGDIAARPLDSQLPRKKPVIARSLSPKKAFVN
jgi:integrase